MTNNPPNDPHNRDDLEQQVSDYFNQQSLGPRQTKRILAQSRQRKHSRRLPLIVPTVGVAAMLLLAIVVSTLNSNSLAEQRTGLALKEAAMNHRTKMRLDVEADQLASLQQGLGDLPFALQLPEQLARADLTLLGGRYCTISGNLAAHLKFLDSVNDEHISLFLTPTAENLEAMHNRRTVLAGTKVRLWRENGVVYALARSSTL